MSLHMQATFHVDMGKSCSCRAVCLQCHVAFVCAVWLSAVMWLDAISKACTVYGIEASLLTTAGGKVLYVRHDANVHPWCASLVCIH